MNRARPTCPESPAHRERRNLQHVVRHFGRRRKADGCAGGSSCREAQLFVRSSLDTSIVKSVFGIDLSRVQVTALDGKDHADELLWLAPNLFINNSHGSTLACPAPAGIYMCHVSRGRDAGELRRRYRQFELRCRLDRAEMGLPIRSRVFGLQPHRTGRHHQTTIDLERGPLLPRCSGSTSQAAGCSPRNLSSNGRHWDIRHRDHGVGPAPRWHVGPDLRDQDFVEPLERSGEI